MTAMKFFFALALVGALFMARGASAQTVLFDNAHGERFLIDETGPLHLSGLVEVIRSSGARVATLDQPISEASLSGVDALVISGAFSPLSSNEIEAVTQFMRKGGKLVVMLHIAPPLAPLLERLKVGYTNGAIRERENTVDDDPQKFWVERFASHPLLQGVERFTLHGAWGLINRDGSTRVIASTGPHAWVDLQGDKLQKKENTASFGVAVAGEIGSGGFVVFADDAIFQNRYLDKNNRALAANLAQWLK